MRFTKVVFIFIIATIALMVCDGNNRPADKPGKPEKATEENKDKAKKGEGKIRGQVWVKRPLQNHVCRHNRAGAAVLCGRVAPGRTFRTSS
jgi:hypothetical protein